MNGMRDELVRMARLLLVTLALCGCTCGVAGCARAEVVSTENGVTMAPMEGGE